MNRARWSVVALLVALIGAWFVFDFGRYVDLHVLKEQQAMLQGWYAAHPWRTASLFFLLYVLFATTSVPGGAVMSLIAGAMFGVALGTLLVSFASSIGATLAFLASRYLFRDVLRQRFGERLRALDAGMAQDGALYLFSLRLVPVLPFFLVNFLMGLTAIHPFTYYWVSQLGMFAGTLVYVNAGTQLARIDAPQDILSPGLVLSLSAIGLFPLLAKRTVAFVRTHWRRSRSAPHLALLGGGAIGLMAVHLTAALEDLGGSH